jgi:hypothetical protein
MIIQRHVWMMEGKLPINGWYADIVLLLRKRYRALDEAAMARSYYRSGIFKSSGEFDYM